jgi:hypothetical protein
MSNIFTFSGKEAGTETKEFEVSQGQHVNIVMVKSDKSLTNPIACRIVGMDRYIRHLVVIEVRDGKELQVEYDKDKIRSITEIK